MTAMKVQDRVSETFLENSRIVGIDTGLDEDGNAKIVVYGKSASVGMKVQKYGRTPQFTSGEMFEVNVRVRVCYDRFYFWCLKSAEFEDQIAVTPGDFSDGGYSGALIVTDDPGKNPVGLPFAGTDSRTLANPIGRVLNRVDVSIDDGS